MSTKWVVTAAAERVVLGDQRQGEASFTVTNPGGAADRAVFDPVAGEGADPSWFSVDDPQRLVRGGASVSYLLKVAVPAEVPPGSYEVQGRVYSVDSAPEESSVLSPRVVLEVPAEPEPDQRKLPWPWLVVAGAVVLVLLVGIGVWVFGGDDDGSGTAAATPTPGATPSPSAELVMPDLLGMSEQEALGSLAALGLTVRPIKYRHDPERADQVVRQSLAPDLVVSPEALVDLEVAVALAAPAVTEPEGLPVYDAVADIAPLEWEAGQSPARTWLVAMSRESCRVGTDNVNFQLMTTVRGCGYPASDASATVEATSYRPALTFQRAQVPFGGALIFHTGWVRWRVAAVDDFGVAGPATEGFFRVAVLR
jgi:hypothetical protein